MPRLAIAAWLALVAAPPAAPQTLRIPSMPQGKLLRKVEPRYPPEALRYRIHGSVRFAALIGEDGRVERLRLISGHPLLVSAAREAVRQWVYRPTLWGRRPVRVLTRIEVHFRYPPETIRRSDSA